MKLDIPLNWVRVAITSLVAMTIINFMLLLWCFKLDGDVTTLFKENTALRSDLKTEKVKREGEDYSLNMRFENLVHYVDKGEYAK